MTSSDLNAEFANGYQNALSAISPLAASLDFDGNAAILDGDQDTYIQASTDDRIDFRIGGTDAIQAGHDGSGNTESFMLLDPGAFTAQASTDIARLLIENSNAVTVPTGTTAIAAALRVEEPNLTATGTITSAVTLYVAAAPTEGGTNNYALWVDAGATQLDGTLAVGGATTLSGDLTLAVSDSRTNSVDVPVIIRSTTSGAAAAGIGTGIQFDAESGDEDPSVFGRLDFAASDVSAGSEDTYAEILLRTAGAAVGSRYRFAATGANNGIFTHANSADRTYTLPDADATFFGDPLTTQGDVPYHNGTSQTRLAAGTSGQFLQTQGGGANPQWATVGITPDTAQATTSGTTKDFTIPAGVDRVTIMFDLVTGSGTDNQLVQLGDSGGIETTGYTSASSTGTTNLTSTAGFVVRTPSAAALSGIMTLCKVSDDIWVSSHSVNFAGAGVLGGGSRTTLDSALTTVRITWTGTDTFASGSVNVFTE